MVEWLVTWTEGHVTGVGVYLWWCVLPPDQGHPMGSPISPWVVNVAMEDFEKALDSALTKPHVWYHYVDDFHDSAWVCHPGIHRVHQLNSQSEHIKFTIEAEQDGLLPFLDTLVILNDDGTLKTKIYCKPTHTDQYLNWDSNHHLEYKSSIVHSLLHRAETVVSELEHGREEVNHIKKVLTVNGYKKWSFQIPNKKVREEDNQQKVLLPTSTWCASLTSLGCQNNYKGYSDPMVYPLTTNLSTP